jgi:diadenosine tetraphosphate (Ap4A) HIT family hydrolase
MLKSKPTIDAMLTSFSPKAVDGVPHFSLHPQLAKDSLLICTLTLSQVRLINDARFDWLILVPLVADAVEWFELAPAQQSLLHQESMQVASRLKNYSGCTKINMGALGNVVRQLHVHIIARHENDACWPRPVWGTVMEPMHEKQLASKQLALAKLLTD